MNQRLHRRASAPAALLLALPAGLLLAATRKPADQESGSGGGVPGDGTGVAAADEYRREIEPILRLRCFECHAGEEPESDLRLDDLPWDFEDDIHRELWEAVYDELEAQRMPPFESTGLTRDERFFLLGRLYGALGRAGADVRGVPRLRRLSVFEVKNSIRDLLAVDTSLLRPLESFPEDDDSDGFDTVGATLTVSDAFLAALMDYAHEAVTRALAHRERAPVRKLRIEAPFVDRGGGILTLAKRVHVDEYDELFHQPVLNTGYLMFDRIEGWIEEPGEYRIRVRAAGVGREHKYDLLGMDTRESLRLGVYAASLEFGRVSLHNPSLRRLASFELQDDTPAVYECSAWLEAGYVPFLIFDNGPYCHGAPDAAYTFLRQLREQYFPGILEKDAEHEAKASQKVQSEALAFVEQYDGPRVRVHDLEIEGPLTPWPPPSRVAVFGDADPDGADLEQVLHAFAARAYRRPPTRAEIAWVVDLAAGFEAGGTTRHEALRIGLEAILASPEFLMLRPPEGPDDGYELASRLSYFLWSSSPDEELLRAAAEGALSDPAELRRQVERMLELPRARAFVEHFPERWLGFYELGEMPPDPDQFPDFYRLRLEEVLRKETTLFFADVLQSDGDIGLFLEADYTYLDSSLARIYGIPGVQGPQFRRVELESPERGGLLGQASVLTVTANGMETSPIHRGVWVLARILGTPPTPPPPDVPALSPDIRGSTTIREQLDRHRELESCSQCHDHIDPLGFPLERFDPIGGWRISYPENDLPVEPSAVAPDGQELADFVDLRHYLAVARKDDFARALIAKLLTYSTGALVRPDDPRVAPILEELQQEGYGLRTLVHLIVQSDAFRGFRAG